MEDDDEELYAQNELMIMNGPYEEFNSGYSALRKKVRLVGLIAFCCQPNRRCPVLTFTLANNLSSILIQKYRVANRQETISFG